MKKYIYYLSAMLMSVGTLNSCSSDDNDIDGSGSPKLKISVMSASNTAAVGEFPHNVYLAQNGNFVQFLSAGKAADLGSFTVESGDYVAYGFAASTLDNIAVPAATESNMENAQVKLKDIKNDIPEILVGKTSAIKFQNLSLLKNIALERTVGSVVVTVAGLEIEARTIKLFIDNMCDQVKLSDGLAGKSGAEFFSKEVTLTKNENDHYLGATIVLPTNADASALSFRYAVGDRIIASSIIESNITKLEANKEYTVNTRFSSVGGTLIARTSITAQVWKNTPVISDNIPTEFVTVAGITPVLGGKMTDVTITGINFGTEVSKIEVFFGEKSVKVTEVTETAVKVTVTEYPGVDEAVVKVVKTRASGAKEESILENQKFAYAKQWWVSTFAGIAGQSGLVDGPLATAKFVRPIRLRWDNNNNLVVCDDNGGVTGGGIRLINMNTKTVSTIVGNIYEPGAIGFNEDYSKMWVSVGNVSIRPKLGHIVTRNADKTWENAASVIMNDDKGLFKTSSNDHIFGLATVGNYVYFLTKYGNQLIRMNQDDGDYIEIANTLGLPNWCAMAYCPYDGKMYVVGNDKYRVYRFDPDKENLTAADVEVFIGSGVKGKVEGKGTAAQIGECYGIDADAQGNVYLVDQGYNCIWKIDKEQNAKIIAGGTSGYLDGPARNAKFAMAYSITIGPDGKIYVGELNNRAIRCVAFE